MFYRSFLQASKILCKKTARLCNGLPIEETIICNYFVDFRITVLDNVALDELRKLYSMSDQS